MNENKANEKKKNISAPKHQAPSTKLAHNFYVYMIFKVFHYQIDAFVRISFFHHFNLACYDSLFICCRCRCLLLCYVVSSLLSSFFRSWIELVSGHWLISFKYHNHSWQWKCNLFQIEHSLALGFGSIRDSFTIFFVFCFCILFYVFILGSLCLTQSTLLSGAIMRNEDKLWSFNMLYVSHTITFIKLLTLRAVFFFSFFFSSLLLFAKEEFLCHCNFGNVRILMCMEHGVRKKNIQKSSALLYI